MKIDGHGCGTSLLFNTMFQLIKIVTNNPDIQVFHSTPLEEILQILILSRYDKRRERNNLSNMVYSKNIANLFIIENTKKKNVRYHLEVIKVPF